MTTVAAAREEKVDCGRGYQLFIRSWRPSVAPRAVVAICHVHDLLNDLGKETVMADIVAWLNARIPT